MTFRKFFAYTFVPVFADMVAVNSIFLLFTFTSPGEFSPVPFPPYALLGMLAVLVNCLLAKMGSSIGFIVAANTVVVLLSEAVMFRYTNGLSGGMAYAVAFICFLYPAVRSLFLVRNPKGPDGMLIYAELSLLGTGFFLFLQITSFEPGLSGNALCLLAVALNIGVLSSQRILGEHGAEGGSGMQRGFILAALAALLLAVATAIGLLLIPNLRPLIFACINGVKALVALIIGLVVGFFIWLASLFPESSIEGEYEMPPPDTFHLEEMEEVARAIPREAIIALIALSIIAAIGLAVYLLARFGKIRVHGLRFRPMKMKARSNADSFFRLLGKLLRHIRSGLYFRYRLLTRRRTYPAVFLRVERRGKRLGYPKGIHETPAGYLTRLRESTRCEGEAAHAFLLLERELNRCCYGPVPDRSARMEQGEITLLLRALRKKPPTLRELVSNFKNKLLEPKKEKA